MAYPLFTHLFEQYGPVVTAAELAKILKTTTSEIYKERSLGVFPILPMGENRKHSRLRFSIAVVAAYLEDNSSLEVGSRRRGRPRKEAR